MRSDLLSGDSVHGNHSDGIGGELEDVGGCGDAQLIVVVRCRRAWRFGSNRRNGSHVTQSFFNIILFASSNFLLRDGLDSI